jgi:hypothetical protein
VTVTSEVTVTCRIFPPEADRRFGTLCVGNSVSQIITGLKQSFTLLRSQRDVGNEMNKRSLRIFLPAEDDKQFYEGGAFQNLMGQVSVMENVNLKQEGKNLFLQTFVKSYDGSVRADEAIGIIQKLYP